jgi:hypothetical protein
MMELLRFSTVSRMVIMSVRSGVARLSVDVTLALSVSSTARTPSTSMPICEMFGATRWVKHSA